MKKTEKNLGHKTPEHIQTAIDLANSVLNDELVEAKPSMSQKELIKIIEEIYGHCKHPDGEQCSEKLADLILSAGSQEKREVDIEIICEKVHQAYCKYHLENKGTEYWTKGDYSKLTEEGKEYDRKTVRAVLEALDICIINEKQEVSFDKEKTAILNELVNGTGKK